MTRVHAHIIPPGLDITDADSVEFDIDQGGRFWINVDHQCVVRGVRAKKIIINDRRNSDDGTR